MLIAIIKMWTVVVAVLFVAILKCSDDDDDE